jgi:NAD(P)-dependent dehydrogenase (short-subunit alcohol dehydrogenase family)
MAIAQWFDARDWSVALLDIDGEQLRRTFASWPHRERALALHADVSDAAQVAAAVARTDAAFGRIDALVNNAGVAVFKPILQTSFDDWRRVMATNLDGAFLCTQAVAPLMLSQASFGHPQRPAPPRGDASEVSKGARSCGSVVHIASISGLAPALCAWPMAPARRRCCT